MNEWTKILVSSAMAASVVSAIVSWLTSAQSIRLERWSRQGEAGYEQLIRANARHQLSQRLMEASQSGDKPQAAERARAMRFESDMAYITAQHNIAAYGSPSVVAAMSAYDATYMGADKSCDNGPKFRADVRIYQAIRNSLGVGGNVSDEDLATILFPCSLR